MTKITIEFPNDKLSNSFAEWLCNSGEQQFMEAVQTDFPSLRFGYHGPENKQFPTDDPRRYGKFMCDNTIRVEINS